MKKSAFLLIAVCFLLIVNGSVTVNPVAAADSGDYSQVDLERDQERASGLVEKLPIQELGPLAPVAMSPFFGLACLSGTAVLGSNNEFLDNNEVLDNWLVFLLFSGLAVVTSVPRLVSTSKIFAESMDRVETYAGIISYGVILMAAQGAAPEADQVVYNAGFISITYSGLLAIAAAVNIFVISTVRLFFELLTLISPIPTLDAMFECANKTVAGIIACVYAFDPWLAFVLNLILFLICLVIFKWANRRINYLKAVLLEPCTLKIIRGMIGGSKYDPDRSALRKYARCISGLQLVVKCFPMRKMGQFKVKQKCYLTFGADGVSLIRPGLFKPPLIEKLDPSTLTKDIDEGLLAYSVTLEVEKPIELVFGRVYTKKLDEIKEKLILATAQKPAEPEPEIKEETTESTEDTETEMPPESSEE